MWGLQCLLFVAYMQLFQDCSCSTCELFIHIKLFKVFQVNNTITDVGVAPQCSFARPKKVARVAQSCKSCKQELHKVARVARVAKVAKVANA